jgi:hypothetical protein
MRLRRPGRPHGCLATCPGRPHPASLAGRYLSPSMVESIHPLFPYLLGVASRTCFVCGCLPSRATPALPRDASVPGNQGSWWPNSISKASLKYPFLTLMSTAQNRSIQNQASSTGHRAVCLFLRLVVQVQTCAHQMRSGIRLQPAEADLSTVSGSGLGHRKRVE